MRADSGLADLYARAAAATAAGSKSFYFATRFFPPELARSAHAVYWFCRTTDDLVDECPTIEQGRRDLEEWNLALRQALRTGDSWNPTLKLFLDATQRHSIPAEYAFELIEGMRMDLNGQRYETFSDLRVFCYRVASTVGLMMSHVIGFTEPARMSEGLRYAEELGVAMQLTNILRDIGEDLQRGRLYLPASELEKFGVSEAQLRQGILDERYRRLMAFQITRAREHYAKAAPGIPMLDARGRFAVKIAAEVYARILHRIEANGMDSLSKRAVVPSHQKYWLTARIMSGPILRNAAGRIFA
jgi:phytoene synthase